jgi:anti-sigma-K factor RskA
MNYQKPELRKRLVDEYVLGTLHGRARTRFERLMRDDFTLRELVNKSSSQWHSLAESVTPIQPPQSVWDNIKTRTQPGDVPKHYPSLLSGLSNFWKTWAVLATVTALFFGVNALRWQSSPAESIASDYFILITDDKQSKASWMIGANTKNQTMAVKALSPQSLPADRVFQLWVKVKNENTVRSVGLIPASGKVTIPVDDTINALLANVEKFGVSIEPPGGSPTGQPTTTPLYHGKIIEL